ncbi:MAG: hypothetical protein LBK61_05885 [Spirochaetaceae bacterium]|nr:hypothetical protein [Spirochaetaceae bacterium]
MVQPRLGGRKLFHILGPELAGAGVPIGRDRFFEVLKEKGLLLDRLPGAPRTTDSRHSLPVFHNLVKDMELTGPNQAWAADITYIRTGEGFLYLSLPSKTRVILRNLRTVRTRFYRGTHSPCKGASKCARDWRGLATAQPGPER